MGELDPVSFGKVGGKFSYEGGVRFYHRYGEVKKERQTLAVILWAFTRKYVPHGMWLSIKMRYYR